MLQARAVYGSSVMGEQHGAHDHVAGGAGVQIKTELLFRKGCRQRGHHALRATPLQPRRGRLGEKMQVDAERKRSTAGA